MSLHRINLDVPRWDQSNFIGRFKHFLWITDPRLSMISTKKLLEAKSLLEKYRRQEEPPGTDDTTVRRAQQLFLSAFHPDTGELQNFMGRMSFQVPGGFLLIGAMITFYKSNTAVVFWQWVNQSFNAVVNYTNRNAGSEISTKQLAVAYVSATTSALVTALGLKSYLATRAPPLVQRFVPFAAVAAANMVNIPLMRQSELKNGVPVYDKNGNRVTESKYAALKGISQVVFSRIIMAAPSMTLLPLLMEKLEKKAFLIKYPKMIGPLQTFLSGVILLVMTPGGCAIFPQKCSMPTERLKLLDKEKFLEVKQKYGDNIPERLYFNKGL